jgi:monomeric isocitrate dehydrogenase
MIEVSDPILFDATFRPICRLFQETQRRLGRDWCESNSGLASMMAIMDKSREQAAQIKPIWMQHCENRPWLAMVRW